MANVCLACGRSQQCRRMRTKTSAGCATTASQAPRFPSTQRPKRSPWPQEKARHASPPQRKRSPMNNLFDNPIQSETLTAEELETISGCCRKVDQIKWLQQNGWTFIRNRAGAPIIGRLYARLRLSGINPASLVSTPAWAPDLSKVR
ncbi:DUF4224 domain-containing protein [Janthinobacterium violaceinigrum]|uniref:DUF4224 domain-containing protein n=2 Tax=Janthinobacterium violaceinigrum TaxID=2654252 RepID=A0A6I1I7I6_9BURK|nr:DUF4224 domain-containing protein [Janthinobacterium violaceinigrum]